MTFTRSGGFVAAPGMTVEGTVSLDANGGTVTADDGAYTHRVAAGESADLMKHLDVGRLEAVKPDQQAASRGSADGYQYEIALETPDGKRHSLTVGEHQSAGQLDAMAPGLGQLVDWVRREAEAIWQARVTRR